MADPKIILPEKGKNNILITSALPYVNNIPPNVATTMPEVTNVISAATFSILLSSSIHIAKLMVPHQCPERQHTSSCFSTSYNRELRSSSSSPAKRVHGLRMVLELPGRGLIKA
jgi:hypothetical protein